MNPEKAARPAAKYHLAPQTGAGLTMQRGQVIRIIDVAGEQVADLVCFARQDSEEYLSSGDGFNHRRKRLFGRQMQQL